MRTFQPLDIVQCLALGMNRFPNHAITSAGICKPQSFYAFISSVSRRRLQPRSKLSALVWDGDRFRSVAFFRPRSGPRSWEVSHLYADADSDGALIDLLEQVGVASANGGAERVFFRVEADSDIIPIARRAGFFPCFRETLYREQRDASAEVRRGLFDAGSHSVKRRPEHDHALFRLYNQTTPMKVRQLAAMTLGQWKDSREPMGRSSRERVLDLEGDVRGWIGTSIWSGVGRIEVMLHPDRAALAPDIVEFGLRSLVKAKSVVAVVPDYVPILGRALEDRGFRPEAEFAVLVKSLARMARQPSAARASLAAE